MKEIQRRKRKMKNKVYGIIGIKAIMSNWNADFSGYPKTTPTGEIFASDKALKFTMRKFWEEQGEMVLYTRSHTLVSDSKGRMVLVPRSLSERYTQFFKSEVTEKTNSVEVLGNLFKVLDVRTFGATFAETKNNYSITGAVQIGQGMNVFENTQTFDQQILSPFRDKTSDELAQNTTIGSMILSDEAHYYYPFSINPNAYRNYIELSITEGYKDQDYQAFKKAALSSVSAFSSNSKAGCDNEFALFIETDEKTYLPNLTNFISFKKGGDKDTLHLDLGKLIEAHKDQIKSVEIYFDSLHLDIESDISNAQYFDIYTKVAL